VPSTTAIVPAARGRSGEDVLALLKTMREADPDEPLWRGVESMVAEGDRIRVAFREPKEPMLGRVGGVEVACHLYDDAVEQRAPSR
jgi:peptide/nickel transport system ATP-binding protein